MKIAVTGHRPDKLWGYNLNRPEWQALKWKFEQMLVEYGCDEALTGMALGVDTVFALAVLNLKKYGRDIKLHCVIPCKNQSARWTDEDKRLYDYILQHADKVTYISQSSYRPWLMQRRNECMAILPEHHVPERRLQQCVSLLNFQM